VRDKKCREAWAIRQRYAQRENNDADCLPDWKDLAADWYTDELLLDGKPVK
jgi:hypothetical protein